MNVKIGAILKKLRKENNVTQDALASAVGVTPQAISRWESESGYPDIELLLVLAVRVLAALLFSLFVSSLSALLRRLLPSLFVSVLSLGVPSALALTGTEIGRAVNIAGWLDGHTLALFSMEKDLFRGDLLYLFAFTLIFIAVTATLQLASRRKFVK